jgi:hypothetical protein
MSTRLHAAKSALPSPAAVLVEFRAEIELQPLELGRTSPTGPAVLSNALGSRAPTLQPGQPCALPRRNSKEGGAFGIANSTVSKDVGLGAQQKLAPILAAL